MHNMEVCLRVAYVLNQRIHHGHCTGNIFYIYIFFFLGGGGGGGNWPYSGTCIFTNSHMLGDFSLLWQWNNWAHWSSQGPPWLNIETLRAWKRHYVGEDIQCWRLKGKICMAHVAMGRNRWQHRFPSVGVMALAVPDCGKRTQHVHVHPAPDVAHKCRQFQVMTLCVWNTDDSYSTQF